MNVLTAIMQRCMKQYRSNALTVTSCVTTPSLLQMNWMRSKTMIEIDGILYDADDYYYWEHLQACLNEMEIDDA